MRLLTILLMAYIPVSAQQLHGRVIAVHDGDTFTMQLADSSTRVVRLAMIDCPEIHQPYGYQARKYTARAIFGKNITADSLKRDKYNRIIAVVYTPGGDTLNHALLRNGMAWQYLKYDTDAYRQTLEANAREQKTGLWALPMAPWEWRRMSKD